MTRLSGPRPVRSRRSRARVVPLTQVPPKRLWIIFWILAAGLLGLVGRMAWLQLVQAPALEQRARQLQTQRTQPLGQRRPIVDRTGRLVAMDEKRFRLWAHPRYFNMPGDDPNAVRPAEDVAEVLAEPLARPAPEILEVMGNQASGIKLAEELDPETADRIAALGISGFAAFGPLALRFFAVVGRRRSGPRSQVAARRLCRVAARKSWFQAFSEIWLYLSLCERRFRTMSAKCSAKARSRALLRISTYMDTAANVDLQSLAKSKKARWPKYC